MEPVKDKSRLLPLFEYSSSIIIVSVLATIFAIVAIFLYSQYEHRKQDLRSHGMEIARIISAIPYQELFNGTSKNNLVEVTKYTLTNSEFAYASISDKQGAIKAKVVDFNSELPALMPASEPSDWLSVQSVFLQTNDREVYDFQAPLFQGNHHVGFLRLGLYKPMFFSGMSEVSIIALIILPMMLTIGLLVLMIERSESAMRNLGKKISQSLAHNENSHTELKATGELSEFISNFNQYIESSRSKISSMETANRELEASTKLLVYQQSKISTVLDSLPSGMLVFDQSGAISYFNSKIFSIFSLEKDSVLENDLSWCKDKKVRTFIQRIIANPARNCINNSMEFQHSSSPDRIYKASAYPMYSTRDVNEIEGVMLLFSDYSEEKLAKTARGEFVAHIAHELKNPLNVLSMYSEMLLTSDGEDYKTRVEAVNIIQDEVERLSLLINNLLNITRIEMGSLKIERGRTKLKDLLVDIYETNKRSGNAKNITFNLELPNELSSLYIDKDLLRVAINNLLTNAIKYCNEGGVVTLAAEQVDNKVMIRVSDDGIGIAQEDQEMIFEKFYRSESAQVRERTGHGLGLSLANDIVRIHHGSMSVESELNKGAEFTITLENNMDILEKVG